MRLSKTRWLTSVIFVTLAMGFVNCSSDEDDDEDSDGLGGVWNSSCARYVSDEETEDADLCNDGGSGDTATARTACQTKYQAYYYQDKLTFRDAGAEITDGVYKTMKVERTTYTADDCGSDDAVATLTRVFYYQNEPGHLVADDSIDENDDEYPTDAKAINFQLQKAELLYHETDSVETVQDVVEVCENDDWDTTSAVEITDKENCPYLPNLLFDDLGITSYATTNTDGNIRQSGGLIFSPFGTMWTSSWDADGVTTEAAFLTGDDAYSFYVLDTTEDPKEITMGDLFDFTPFSTRDWDDSPLFIQASDDDDDDDANGNENGDSDAQRQRDAGLTYTFDQDETDNL